MAEYFTLYPIVERQVKDLVGRRFVAPEGRKRNTEAPKGRERNAVGSYVEIAPDAGRVYSKELDLFFQIDAASKELVAIDAKTSQRLLTSDEEEARADREAEARRQAEKRAEQAEQGLRRNVEDLCGLLEIEWSSERSTAVADMDSAQLETLWAHLMNRKRWP